MTLDRARRQWWMHGTASFLLFGAGVSVIFDAAFRRMSEAHWEIWVVEGTVGLGVMMAGLAYFGSAVRHLVYMDRIAEYSDRRARSRARSRSQKERLDFGLRANPSEETRAESTFMEVE